MTVAEACEKCDMKLSTGFSRVRKLKKSKLIEDFK